MSRTAYNIPDAEITELLKKRGRMMTYVVRNWLSDGRPNLKTDFIRRRLEKMEAAGLVRQVPRREHPYARQICWAVHE